VWGGLIIAEASLPGKNLFPIIFFGDGYPTALMATEAFNHDGTLLGSPKVIVNED
jgi:hypothetical protein